MTNPCSTNHFKNLKDTSSMFLVEADHRRSTHTNYLIVLLKSGSNFRSSKTDNYTWSVSLVNTNIPVLALSRSAAAWRLALKRCALYAPFWPGQELFFAGLEARFQTPFPDLMMSF